MMTQFLQGTNDPIPKFVLHDHMEWMSS